jgi:hypothetical protein
MESPGTGQFPLPPDAVAALAQGDKIAAIKIVRERHGIDLKQAKDVVDRYVRDHPELHSGIRDTQARSARGCLPWLLVLVALLAVGWYHLARR